MVMVMDNLPAHKTQEVAKYLRRSGWTVVLLPVGCPEYNPIELYFGWEKHHLASWPRASSKEYR